MGEKIKAYIRIGKHKKGYKVAASGKPNYEPLKVSNYGTGGKFIPTVAFGIEFEIPDKLFKGASLIIGMVNVGEDEVKISTSFPVPKLKP